MTSTLTNETRSISDRPHLERNMTMWLIIGLALVALFLIGAGIATYHDQVRMNSVPMESTALSAPVETGARPFPSESVYPGNADKKNDRVPANSKR